MNKPICKHLRTKRLFIPALAADAFSLEEDPHEVVQCWCNKTMTELGRDDRHVSYEDCSDEKRSCFRL